MKAAMNGLFLLNRISRRPVAHLFCWVSAAGPPEGAHPRNAGGSGRQSVDFQPLACILIPVRTSSVVLPYKQPI